MKKTIAVLEGDGIGPEIVAESIKVLKAVEKKYAHDFDLVYAPFGAEAFFTEGSPFPEKTVEICDRADVIIKGPVGLAVEKMNQIPQEMRPEVGAILPLRKRYDTFANYRPVRLPKKLASFSPLKEGLIGEGLDILMIRELVGGIYFGEKTEGKTTGMLYAEDDCKYTDEQVRRVAVVAFEEARRLRTRLTNIHKANVLATSRFWRDIVEDVGRSYEDVEYRSMLVDNAAFQLVKNPTQFNGVVLLENMQGDILTDQAGGVLGSLGLMPSACIGFRKGYVGKRLSNRRAGFRGQRQRQDTEHQGIRRPCGGYVVVYPLKIRLEPLISGGLMSDPDSNCRVKLCVPCGQFCVLRRTRLYSSPWAGRHLPTDRAVQWL
ncbi:MAG: isocitrate/isopropylmalate family dehydrogenase [Acidobacteriota bacterium]